VVVVIVFLSIIALLGYTINLGVLQLIAPVAAATAVAGADVGSVSEFAVWPLFLTLTICGAAGGFVQALECDNYHEIPVPFKDGKVDSGVFGHIFIGVFGAIVALSLMIAIFGLKLSPALEVGQGLSKGLELFFYVSAISVIGGYSGLPIISLVSNAALKKVQNEVETLKKEGKERQESVDDIKLEADELRLKNVLLTADTRAGKGYYPGAIELIENDYLTFVDDDYNAYNLLAYCENHNGDIQKAVEHTHKSIKLQPSRLGYYNLACYMTRLDHPDADIYGIIDKSWQYAESIEEKKRLIKCLQDDEDFNKIKDQQAFKDIIEKYKNQLDLGDGRE